MAKYIDADLLRKEINERLSCNGAFDEVGDSAWHYDQGIIAAYKHILSFIDSLTEEPDKSLEEAAEKYSLPFRGGRDIWMSDITNAFKAGAEWQKEQVMKEAMEADVNTYEDLVLNYGCAEFVVDMPFSEIEKFGDKARIIILKEAVK